MALGNYDELKKEVEDWAHDDLGTKFDTFLKLTETEINSNPDESLKILSLEQRVELTTSTTSRFLDLPVLLNKQFSIQIELDCGTKTINYVSAFNLNDIDDSGTPWLYTISANQIEFNITPDQEYKIIILYAKQNEPLTKDNQTNITLERYPNIYLYGCLSQAFSYTQEDQQEQKYGSYFIQAIRDANAREREIKYPTGTNKRPMRVV